MTIKRYGSGGHGAGGQPLPFARATEAGGWLYVSGQVAMENGEIVQGGVIAETRKTMENVLAILEEAGYGSRMWSVSGFGLTIRETSGASMASTRNTLARIRPRALASRRG